MNFQKLITNYLDMEAYGSNQIIKSYCRFPKYLPLPAHLEHGWTPLPNALVTDIEIAEKKGMMLVYSQRRKKAWIKDSKTPVMVMGAPFIRYREMQRISKSPVARGTIVFPSHSTIFLDSEYDLDAYCEKLKMLPSKFQPVTICLLQPDIEKGRDKTYIKYGFEVVSAGPKLRGSLEFVKKYYDILSCYKYATSNEIGSYTFYSVNLGLPFFLYGAEPTIINVNNRDKNIKGSAKLSDFFYGREAINHFCTGPITEISLKQAKYVASEMGSSDCDNSEVIRDFLFNQTKNIKYWLLFIPMFWLFSLIKLVVPQDLAYNLFRKFSK